MGHHLFKILCAISLLVLVSIASANSTDVRFADGELHYLGTITAQANKTVRDIYASQRGTIDWLVITSPGGEVNVAMDLGDWVFEHQLNVRIVDYCFSSCANYVFPAARMKIIESGALVAWHGSALQSIRRSRREIAEVIDRDVLPFLPEHERGQKRSELVANSLNYLRAAQARQSAFFNRIGVDERITTTGENATAVKDFWFLSKRSMNSFGIKSVVTPPDYNSTDTSRFGDSAIVFIDHAAGFE